MTQQELMYAKKLLIDGKCLFGEKMTLWRMEELDLLTI